MIRKILFLICLLLIIQAHSLAKQRPFVQTNEVIVFFDGPLEKAAREIAAIYPGLKSEMEEIIGWELNYRPAILLVHDAETFRKMVNHDMFVAFAAPRKKLIVIDYSKMNGRRFKLRITLKHEVCHLLLHHHIGTANLPRWLDEGVSQWASDGLSELIMDRKRYLLDKAALTGKYLSLRELTRAFPRDKLSLSLAYEQSKSLVKYVEEEFGENKILEILGYLKSGDNINTAIRKSISISPDELESRWHRYLRRRTTWFVYLAANIYEILFFLSALAAIYGFIKSGIRKRAYRDEEEEEEGEEWEDFDG
ncbi:peptidase MA family metallohydrolase [Desulfococcaceae bacterium HSG8]|nr:peptidase MA family metallohydrolase [Desulfococcaceae bacterium HSG8]